MNVKELIDLDTELRRNLKSAVSTFHNHMYHYGTDNLRKIEELKSDVDEAFENYMKFAKNPLEVPLKKSTLLKRIFG